jgi:prepilin-type N-terminal cleavage/methylation domain-containing protein
MAKRTPRGFTLLELIVVISIIGILGVVVIERLQRYAEFAEKTSMEYTANIVNSGLLFEFARRLTHGERGGIPALVGVNPVQWLAQKPTNYLGEFRDPPVGDEFPGNWYYDTGTRELVYLIKRSSNFQTGASGKNEVRYRIRLHYDEDAPGGPKSVVAAVLTPVEPYRWF